jgi:hypothetical protein
MFGPTHYDDLAQLGRQRQATLLREAEQWRLTRLAHSRAKTKGRRSGEPLRWLRLALAETRWALTHRGDGLPSGA